jgi:hypothetical protein
MGTVVSDNSKKYEKAPSNDYIGVVIDIVDLGKVHTAFGDKPKVRIVWALNAKDSEGNPYRTIQQVVASMNQKSNLYKVVKDILGSDPPVPYDLDNLIGISKRLIIQTEPDKRTGELFSNIRVILPLAAGQQGLPIPQGFVRARDRQQGYQGSGSAPAQQSQPAPAPVNLSAPTPVNGAPAPTF